MDENIHKLNERASHYSEQILKPRTEVKNKIIGQDDIIDNMLIALISQGHVLLEGVPGLAKTLMAKTMAECLDCDFVRLQFTPNLLPADITGTKIYNHNEASFFTLKGPIFANFILADEINRAPPKVQSALLKRCRKDREYTGRNLQLERPFSCNGNTESDRVRRHLKAP